MTSTTSNQVRFESQRQVTAGRHFPDCSEWKAYAGENQIGFYQPVKSGGRRYAFHWVGTHEDISSKAETLNNWQERCREHAAKS